MKSIYKYLKKLREQDEPGLPTSPEDDEDGMPRPKKPGETDLGDPDAGDGSAEAVPVGGGDDSGDDPHAQALGGEHDMDAAGADPAGGDVGDLDAPLPDEGGDAVAAKSQPDRVFSHPDELAELLKTNPTLFHRIQDLIEKDPATLHLLHDAGKKAAGV